MTYPRNASPAGADAERAAFLRDLRALRDQAGLQSQELAARAHYPEDTLKTAESGPALPTLPVLEAYVRACGARPAEWEERWRQIMQEPATSLELPTRAPTAGRLPTRTAAFSSGRRPGGHRAGAGPRRGRPQSRADRLGRGLVVRPPGHHGRGISGRNAGVSRTRAARTRAAHAWAVHARAGDGGIGGA